MPSIDVYDFIAWHGLLIPAQLGVGLVEPLPGINGYAAAIGAWRADPVIIETVMYASSAAEAQSLRDTFRAMSGQTVSCTDQFGEIWNSVLVMHAVSLYSYSLFNDCRLVTSWKLLVTSEAAPGAS